MRRDMQDPVTLADELEAAMNREACLDDGIKIVGHMHLELFSADGALKDEREVSNLIVTIGRNMLADHVLAAPTFGKPTHMAVGTGGTAEAVGDTALVTESARVALTSKTRTNNVVTMVGDYAAGVATAALTEAGLFNASTAGDMPARATFAVVNKGANDTLKITWTWTIG